ncbi:arsenate reductase ArsC [Methanolobus halotolerans]|uniref:Low molecular weight phosphatase family protein n=1 Tax=Methanolobus halotolerans TaxID=2052935 RepID=A0A4E0PUK0_9EURY|nr:arsenate reductase ArsC [Methanolobus halotolerans]TGC06974.1 low molecular weight phosphatase family protein [Methanolobus halotolerans]
MASNGNKSKVLFICVHNSGRSQIAEEYLNKIAGDRFEVESAGLKPTNLHPLVQKVMEEDGFDLSKKKTQSAWHLFRKGGLYKYVITVCDRANEEGCPLFPKPYIQLNWPFPDPESFTGTEEEQIEQVRSLRDSIKKRIEQFVEETALLE